MRDNFKIKYVFGNEALLDSIKSLWQSLNQYHLDLSPNFKQDYIEMNFEKRKSYWLKKAANSELRVDIAIDSATGLNLAYCVSSIDERKTGQIESIFVDTYYRGCGIGDSLMKRVLNWMDQKGAVAKIVEVAAGNEQAFSFYNQYGFLIRKTVLKQIMKSEN